MLSGLSDRSASVRKSYATAIGHLVKVTSYSVFTYETNKFKLVSFNLIPYMNFITTLNVAPYITYD